MPQRLEFRRIRSSDPHDTEAIDHRRSAPGQTTSVLCGWDGGRQAEHVPGDGTRTCHDCEAIYRWAGGK